jgi:hypothetical protein
MTPTQRTKEFKRLIKLIPGKNLAEKYRLIADITCSQYQTVRCWAMKKPARFIPLVKLQALNHWLEK